jgi:hypothetical protein
VKSRRLRLNRQHIQQAKPIRLTSCRFLPLNGANVAGVAVAVCTILQHLDVRLIVRRKPMPINDFKMVQLHCNIRAPFISPSIILQQRDNTRLTEIPTEWYRGFNVERLAIWIARSPVKTLES